MPSADLPAVESQFESAAQQRHAATLGMWIFLATEVLLFGALFLGFAVNRALHPAAFRAASEHTILVAGTINTALLLVSSLFMVLAVREAEYHRSRSAALWLALTAILGFFFLGLKAIEYSIEIREGLLPGPHFHLVDGGDSGPARLFFSFYFTMTGIHALHVLVGIGLIGFFAFRCLLARSPSRLSTSIDLLGLYWHFVDVVWVFLFPLLYLAGRRP